jgi:hypothetical protein
VITGNFNGGARQISHFSVWPAPPDCLIGAQVHLEMWSDVAMTTLGARPDLRLLHAERRRVGHVPLGQSRTGAWTTPTARRASRRW